MSFQKYRSVVKYIYLDIASKQRFVRSILKLLFSVHNSLAAEIEIII